MKSYPTQAQGSIRTISYNWTKFLRDRGSSITVSSATVEADPSGPTFGSVTTSSPTTSVTMTVPSSCWEGVYMIKWTATLSNGEKEVKSIPIQIVEHKTSHGAEKTVQY